MEWLDVAARELGSLLAYPFALGEPIAWVQALSSVVAIISAVAGVFGGALRRRRPPLEGLETSIFVVVAAASFVDRLKQVWTRFGWFSISIIAAAVWLTIVAISDQQGFTGQTAAAWVQAVGSVAAIVAAVILGERSAKAARQLARESFREQMDFAAHRDTAEEARERKRATQLATIAAERLSQAAELFRASGSLGEGGARVARRGLEGAVKGLNDYMPLALSEIAEVDAYSSIATLIATGLDAIDFFMAPPAHMTTMEAQPETARILRHCADTARERVLVLRGVATATEPG